MVRIPTQHRPEACSWDPHPHEAACVARLSSRRESQPRAPTASPPSTLHNAAPADALPLRCLRTPLLATRHRCSKAQTRRTLPHTMLGNTTPWRRAHHRDTRGHRPLSTASPPRCSTKTPLQTLRRLDVRRHRPQDFYHHINARRPTSHIHTSHPQRQHERP